MSKQATCSAIISFAQNLESSSSKFYEKLAEKYTKDKETFLAFAKESRENKVLITRTYQETISDALEACFIQVNLSDYKAEIIVKEDSSYRYVLEKAIEFEGKANRFYVDAAEQSESLLATIPVALRTIAKRRNRRKPKLISLLKNTM